MILYATFSQGGVVDELGPRDCAWFDIAAHRGVR